jgi:hypothetical protein
MMEQDWSCSTDPQAMLEAVQASCRVSDRKLRLFAVACCRSVGRLMPPDPCLAAVEMSERYADGLVGLRDLKGARCDVQEAPASRRGWPASLASAFSAALQVTSADFLDAGAAVLLAEHTANLGISEVLHGDEANAWIGRWAASQAINFMTDPVALDQAVSEYRNLALARWRPRQCLLLRDIFGPWPFRPPPTTDPAWLAYNNGTVQQLALAAYEERELPSGHLDRHRLVVLADSLEEAGCQDAELLGHLRIEQIHVRGCWALDTILAKE